MYKFSIFILLLSLCFGCQQKVDRTLETIEQLELFLDDVHLENIGITGLAKNEIISYYKKRGFKPRWTKGTSLTLEGTRLKKILSNKLHLGLPENRYDFIKGDTNSKIETEIALTAMFGFMARDLKRGVFQKDTILLRPLSFPNSKKLDSIMRFKKTEKIEYQVIKKGSSDSNYLNFAFALYDYCTLYPIDTNVYHIKAERQDSINSLLETKKALFSKGYIQDLSIDSLNFRKTIANFQKTHNLNVDGKVGDNTATVLNESTYSKIKRAGIVLDKMRTKTAYNSTYIRINLPEYMLRYVYNDSLKSIHRVIIGSTKTPSPTLISKIYKVVFFPYWHVPYSIASKEILPKLQEDTAYLRAHNYKLFQNKEEVDPTNIDWGKIKETNFPYRVRQDFGPTNSLGLIKFSFHNPFWVYVHDTPNRKLFVKEVRAMSHGCIRCDSIPNLAKQILFNDRKSIINDNLNVDTLLVKNIHQNIQLKQSILIYIEYETVVVSHHELIFLNDVYKRDEAYLKLW